MPLFSVARMVEASKRFGLTVEVVPGAETRGSSAFQPYGFIGHHTAGPATGDRPSLNICVNGRPDLDGPLCNDFLTRGGVNVIVAGGRANHAGLGGFRGLVGNSAVWGCEAEDDGDGVWTAAQVEAYPRVVAARLWLIDRDESWYAAHRTWAPTRKVDPTGISDEWMRQRVAPLLAAGSASDVTSGGTFVTLSAADEAKLVKAADQILGAVAAGQTGFAGTVQATLGTVQSIVNVENAQNAQIAALTRQLGDTRTAVLAAVAAMPTAGMTETQRVELAQQISTLVAQHGVTVDAAALAQALAVNLAGRLQA